MCSHVQVKFSRPQHSFSLHNNCKWRKTSTRLESHCALYPPVKILILFDKTQEQGQQIKFASPLYRNLSHGGHFESQENKKFCFCTSSLALDERLDVQNLLFQHWVIIKVYWTNSEIDETAASKNTARATKTWMAAWAELS